MIIPPIIAIIVLYSLKKLPSAVKESPRIKNDIDIPNTKNRVYKNTFFLLYIIFPSFVFSLAFTARYPMYNGNSGITQGEKNEIIPSNKTVTPCIKKSIFYLLFIMPTILF